MGTPEIVDASIWAIDPNQRVGRGSKDGHG